MRKSLTVIAWMFVAALVALPAWAQEDEGDSQPAPPTQQTIEVDRGPQVPVYLEAKHGVVPGPEAGEDQDPVYQPGDPLELYAERRDTTVPAQIANPTSGGLTRGAGGSGASALATGGRFGGAVSSLEQDARRGIRQLIRQLEARSLSE